MISRGKAEDVCRGTAETVDEEKEPEEREDQINVMGGTQRG